MNLDDKDTTTLKQSVALVAAPRGWSEPLLAEQGVPFDLKLKNLTPSPLELLGFTGNDWNPMARVFDAEGTLLHNISSQMASEHLLGHRGEPTRPAKLFMLKPEGEGSTWMNLAKYAGALPPGKYTFQAAHRLLPLDPTEIYSEKLPFEVVQAQVFHAALGYESSLHEQTLLAWIAAPEGGAPRVMVRWSGASHNVSYWGGNVYGETEPDAHVAVSELPADTDGDGQGWVAVLAGRSLELIRHNMSYPTWRSGAIELPIEGGIPISPFPERGGCLFLATGTVDGKSVLAGVVQQPGDENQTVWTVPLAGQPELSACAFGPTGAISLLFASRDQQQTHLSRMDVDESGAVLSPQQVVRTTDHEVHAVAVDSRRGLPLAFVFLEADREKLDHLALMRLPVDGEVGGPDPERQRGWPVIEENEKEVVLRAEKLCLEVGRDGGSVIGLIDEKGDFYGGRLGHSLERFAEAPAKKIDHLHIATFKGGHDVAGFTAEGYLFNTGGHAH